MTSIPDRHIELLVRLYQDGSPLLTSDGVYGPKTARSLDDYLGMNRTQVVNLGAMQQAWLSAMADVGNKESPLRSNSGPYVESLRELTGLPRKGGGEWCAVFISAHLQKAGIAVASRGAPGIVRALGNLPGGHVVSAKDVEVGRIYLSLHRRGLVSHHVRMFRVMNSPGGRIVRHIGGNESSSVVSKVWPADKYLRTCKKIVGYVQP